MLTKHELQKLKLKLIRKERVRRRRDGYVEPDEMRIRPAVSDTSLLTDTSIPQHPLIEVDSVPIQQVSLRQTSTMIVLSNIAVRGLMGLNRSRSDTTGVSGETSAT